jgi:hypothetical protein
LKWNRIVAILELNIGRIRSRKGRLLNRIKESRLKLITIDLDPIIVDLEVECSHSKGAYSLLESRNVRIVKLIKRTVQKTYVELDS